MMIRVVVISDIKIYGAGLSQILVEQRDIQIVGVASSQSTAVDMIANYKPQVILLDITMPDCSQIAEYIVNSSSHSMIVALALNHDGGSIMQCAEVGITCYVSREASIKQLVDVIMRASRGESHYPSDIAACLFKKIQHGADGSGNNSTNFHSTKNHSNSRLEARLTRRERQIAKLMGQGLSNKQIARHLSIEISTVKNHVHNVLVKLGIQRRGQALTLLQQSPVARYPDP